MSYVIVYDSRRWVRSDSTDVTIVLPITAGGTGNTTGTATINANLTGPITSVGNATSIASQTGTGTKFVVDSSPTIVTPTIASFVNATHTHANAAGGGQLTSSAFSSITGSGSAVFATSPQLAGNVGVGVAGVGGIALITKGVSSTTSDYAFAAQDSAGHNLILARDDGTLTLGSASVDPAIIFSPTGDIKPQLAGGGYYCKEGTNACMGVATLVLGTKTVSTTKVTANSRIFLSVESLGTVTVATAVAVTARSAGTSFTITSASATDTSVVSWLIVEPS